jgi:hypothetical protein
MGRVIQKQLDNKTWVAIGRYTEHECCGCGMTHRVDFRWNKRSKRFEERWVPIKTGTKRTQRRAAR